MPPGMGYPAKAPAGGGNPLVRGDGADVLAALSGLLGGDRAARPVSTPVPGADVLLSGLMQGGEFTPYFNPARNLPQIAPYMTSPAQIAAMGLLNSAPTSPMFLPDSLATPIPNLDELAAGIFEGLLSQGKPVGLRGAGGRGARGAGGGARSGRGG